MSFVAGLLVAAGVKAIQQTTFQSTVLEIIPAGGHFGQGDTAWQIIIVPGRPVGVTS